MIALVMFITAEIKFTDHIRASNDSDRQTHCVHEPIIRISEGDISSREGMLMFGLIFNLPKTV